MEETRKAMPLKQDGLRSAHGWKPLSRGDVKMVRNVVRGAPKFSFWAPVAGAAGLWLVYPALTEKFKGNPFGMFGDDE